MFRRPRRGKKLQLFGAKVCSDITARPEPLSSLVPIVWERRCGRADSILRAPDDLSFHA